MPTSVRLRKENAESNIPNTNLKNDESKKTDWGRATKGGVSNFTVILCLSILLFCPLLVIYFWMACDRYDCSLSLPFQTLLKRGISWNSFKSVFLDAFPKPSTEGFLIFSSWVAFQGLLYAFVPSKIGYGQKTPAGHILPYKVNGLYAWIISHVAFVLGSSFFLNFFKASIVYHNWGGLLVAANVYGYILTLFSYVKARLFPSHPEDCKYSGSFIYDLYMGIEFNPRFGKLWDFKLFHNGRPGIVAWTLINLSFAAAQYEIHGFVSNSMILVNFLHFLYVIDFFINEDWYLRTIDIAHDHFGFYLAWGDSVWLPFMYTLQSHYLVRHPVVLNDSVSFIVFALGLFGYYIFRSVNYQKDIIRRTDGKCMIWGKPARVIRAKFVTSDGKEHSSLLLASGWWGLARHFNYTGDLILSFAMCFACGTQHLLPYFYFVYMVILLLNRIQRDDARCTGKYGKYWEEYKKLVPNALIPFVF